MFLLRATYNRPIEEVDQLLEGHKAWIMKNFDEGRILLTARQVPLVGGIILARGESAEEMWAMLEEDPFKTSGMADYEVLEYAPVRAAEGVEGLLEPDACSACRRRCSAPMTGPKRRPRRLTCARRSSVRPQPVEGAGRPTRGASSTRRLRALRPVRCEPKKKGRQLPAAPFVPANRNPRQNL